MPNIDNIKKWVTALRSDKYKQGRSALRRGRYDSGFCCLGVACDVYHLETGLGGWYFDGEADSWNFRSPNDRSNQVMPEDVGKWLGLDLSPYVHSLPGDAVVLSHTRDTGNDIISLAELNDAYVGFHEIAGRIEREYLV